MSQSTIVVLGGALSGPAAAARAREYAPDAHIILLEKNTNVSYAACGLGLYLSGEVKSLADLNQEKADFFKRYYDIEVRTNCQVESIDAAGHQLQLNQAGKSESLTYTKLIFAAGAASLYPPGFNKKQSNVSLFRTLEDLEKIEAALNKGKRVAVLGSGPLGLEACDALLVRGADIHLIEINDQLFADGDDLLSAYTRHILKDKIQLHAGVDEISVIGQGDQVHALDLDGKEIQVDLVILATGLQPRTDLLGSAGANLNADGTVQIDARMQTSLPDIYACGVCIAPPLLNSKDAFWRAQGSLADKSAQVAGANAAGANIELPAASGSMLVEIAGHNLGLCGLTRSQARAAYGNDAASVVLCSTATERYLKDAPLIYAELVYRSSDGLILGATVAGSQHVSRRIDIIATALHGQAKLNDLAGLDLSYSPRLSAARDVLNIAATIALMQQQGLATCLHPAEYNQHKKDYQTIAVDCTSDLADSSLDLTGLADFKAGSGQPIAFLSPDGRAGLLASRRIAPADNCVYIGGGLATLDIFKK